MTSINIDRQNIAGDCNLKCSYFFNYHNSSIVVKNEGYNITLSYDKANVSPVIYNTNKYEVDSIMIVSPSIHLFNGKKTDAEMIIQHRPAVSGPFLSLGIPIVSEGTSSGTSNSLVQIIDAVSTKSPSSGESTSLNISNFNLNNFVIAKKPIFSYSENQDTNSSSWIVFGKENSIGLSSSSLNKLKKIIKPLPDGVAPAGPMLFYNKTGATKGLDGNNDQIYIDCQPVTSSEEKVEVPMAKLDTSFDLNNPTTMLILQVIISCIVFIILLFGIHYGLKYIASLTFSLPKSTKLKS
jgi:carbonic anhydrase